MLIFGHKLLQTQKFFKISKNQIKDLKDENSTLCFHYDEDLIKIAQKKNLPFSIFIKNKDEIFLSHAFGASFLLFEDENLAQFGAKVAEFYLFDSKILLLVSHLKNLEKAYDMGVDGVILKEYIKQL